MDGCCCKPVPVCVFSQAVDIHSEGFDLVFEAETMGDQYLTPADFYSGVPALRSGSI